LIALVTIGAAIWGQRLVADQAQTVMSTVLPVIGTWVGTVLAFYFARENFEAAARASAQMAAGRTESPALDIAIPRAAIESFEMDDSQQPKDVKLADIRKKMNDHGRYRMPIFNKAGVARHVIHQQPLDSHIAARTINKEPPDKVSEATLNDLLNSEQGKQVINAMAFAPERATIGEVKSAMESRPGCQDVFMTRSGSPSEPVIAWVTNNELQKTLSAT
jgi:hypothetical protein